MSYYASDWKRKKNLPIVLDSVSGAGGGGCFPPDTLVRTDHGWKTIQTCSYGDCVLGYDDQGNVLYGYITKVEIHKTSEIDGELLYLYSNGIPLFPKGITSNHAVYDCETNEHKLISDFKLGDFLVDIEENLHEITSKKAFPLASSTESVYNLLVEPLHTFIVGSQDISIRVHNGGGGKGGGGQARTPVEDPNTLQSSAIVRVLEVISAGPIVGVIGGLQGVLLNETAIQNPGGSSNFEGVKGDFRTGTPSQTAIAGFKNINIEISQSVTTITGSGVVRQLPDQNIDAVNITILFPRGLSKLNISNGDLHGNTVSYELFHKDRNIGTYSSWKVITVTDKAIAPVEVQHTIEKPIGSINWDIKIVRLSQEDQSASSISEIALSRITEVKYQTETYPNIALVGLHIPAKSVGNSIPTIAHKVQGLIIKVPINYNPITRNYGSAFWNGAFKLAHTDNPVWVLYDMLTDPVAGLQAHLAYPLVIDTFSFYEASLYCDCATWTGTQYTYQLVSNGQGGFEIRFTFNYLLNTNMECWQLLQAIASNMHCMLVEENQVIRLIQDRPTLPTFFFNNSNVEEGVFEYQTFSTDTISTAVNCTFNNILDRYLPDTITEEANIEDINRFGYREKDIVLFGGTTESAARREARYHLFTELNQTELVSWTVGLNIIDLAVGQVGRILDNDYISSENKYLTGRVVSATGTSVVVDAPVTLDAGKNYIFGIVGLDKKTILERNLFTSGQAVTTSNLQINSSIPAGNYADNEFFCYSVGYIEPRQVKILGIEEKDVGKYTITALTHLPQKYAIVESTLAITPLPPIIDIPSLILPVTNITFITRSSNLGSFTNNQIIVSWDWGGDPTTNPVTYHLQWRRNNDNFTSPPSMLLREYTIDNALPGNYDVIIVVENLQGRRSIPANASFNYQATATVSTLLPPVNLRIYVPPGGSIVGDGSVFKGRQIAIVWDYNTNNDTKTDILHSYYVTVNNPTNSLEVRNTTVIPDTNKNGRYVYPFEFNEHDFVGGSRNVRFTIYSRDTNGLLSPLSLARTFTNPPPVAPVTSIIGGTEGAFITITRPDDNDLAGYLIHRQTSQPLVPSQENLVYDGPDTIVTIPGTSNTNYFFRIAAYDLFGKTGLNYTNQQTVTLLSSDPNIWAFSGLTFTPLTPIPGNNVSWTSGTASVNGDAPVTIPSGFATWTSGVLYLYYDNVANQIKGTTSLAVAVSGAVILGTYRGGTQLILGDGRAFTDGSLLLAGTVGANQLVANSAVITNVAQIANALITTAHIQDLAVINQKIGNEIQSSDWNPAINKGWKITKNGNIVTYGRLEVRDQLGNPIISTGPNPRIPWDLLLGSPYGSTLVADLGQSMDLNLDFHNWGPTSMPAGWDFISGAALPAKNQTDYITEPHSIQLISTTAQDYLIRRRVSLGPQAIDSFLVGNFTSKILSQTSGSNTFPGMIIRVFTNSALTVFTDTLVQHTQTFQGWRRTDWVARVPAGSLIWGVDLFIAASYSSFPGGRFAGTWIVDNIRFNTYDSSVFGSNIIGQINAQNISTYIAGAAIGQAYIANAAIGNAQIQALAVRTGKIDELAVTTLKIAGNAVTLPVVFTNNTDITINPNQTTTVATLSMPILNDSVSVPVIIFATVKFVSSQTILGPPISVSVTYADNSTGGADVVLLQRNVAIIETYLIGLSLPFVLANQAANSTATYKIKITAGSGAASTASDRSIFTFAAKR